eukprot:1146606-Pelagomonas_calceolata.AAC.3
MIGDFHLPPHLQRQGHDTSPATCYLRCHPQYRGYCHLHVFTSRLYLMLTNPFPKLLTAYPHLCYKLRTIPKDELTFDNPQSWPSQEIALPQHTWDLQITVWNTTARVHLNNQSPTWLQGLARDIPEAKWYVKNVRNDPIHHYVNARHNVIPTIRKCEKLPLDKKQTAKVPNKPAVDITDQFLVRLIQTSSSKLQIGSPGPTKTAAARFRTATQLWRLSDRHVPSYS